MKNMALSKKEKEAISAGLKVAEVLGKQKETKTETETKIDTVKLAQKLADRREKSLQEE